MDWNYYLPHISVWCFKEIQTSGISRVFHFNLTDFFFLFGFDLGCRWWVITFHYKIPRIRHCLICSLIIKAIDWSEQYQNLHFFYWEDPLISRVFFLNLTKFLLFSFVIFDEMDEQMAPKFRHAVLLFGNQSNVEKIHGFHEFFFLIWRNLEMFTIYDGFLIPVVSRL